MNHKRAAVAVLGAAVVIAAGVAVVQARDDSADDDEDLVVAELSTVAIEQRDLISYSEVGATLQFAESATIASPVAGTVTSIVAEGSAVQAGTVVATVDGQPVVGLLGEVPAWRDLSIDSEDGVDVRQLETNLVTLGYDPDGAIEIDETFDEATADAVERWEVALGVEDPDGEVPAGQVAYIAGALLVVERAVGVGSSVSAGGALLDTRVTERQVPAAAAIGSGGVVDHLAAPAAEVTSGTVLFWQGGVPVVAVEADVASFPALSRDLSIGVDPGSDVQLFEQLLVAAGADPEGTLVVDDEFDEATAAAVVRWWQSIGALAADATIDHVVVPAGSLVAVPSGLRVGAATISDGAAIAADAVVITLTSMARIVTTTAAVGDSTFVVAAVIDVELPDGTIIPGTVESVGSVATVAEEGADPTVPVTISVDAAQTESVAGLIEVPVTLRVISDETADAFVVPVTALVALAEGGYALEVVDGTGVDGVPMTRLIAVETGQFSDGVVAVTGADLSAGLEVVVPS